MLKRLTSGEYSLKVTFWIFGVLGFSVFALITNITHSSLLRTICGASRCIQSVVLFFFSHFIAIMTSSNSGLQWFMVIHSFLGAIFGGYMLVVLRSLWKCGEKYEGSSFWLLSAKFLLVCLAIICLKSII